MGRGGHPGPPRGRGWAHTRLPNGREFSVVYHDDPKGRTVFTFADYGGPADIVAPPPAEVAEEDNPSFTAALMVS